MRGIRLLWPFGLVTGKSFRNVHPQLSVPTGSRTFRKYSRAGKQRRTCGSQDCEYALDVRGQPKRHQLNEPAKQQRRSQPTRRSAHTSTVRAEGVKTGAAGRRQREDSSPVGRTVAAAESTSQRPERRSRHRKSDWQAQKEDTTASTTTPTRNATLPLTTSSAIVTATDPSVTTNIVTNRTVRPRLSTASALPNRRNAALRAEAAA